MRNLLIIALAGLIKHGTSSNSSTTIPPNSIAGTTGAGPQGARNSTTGPPITGAQGAGNSTVTSTMLTSTTATSTPTCPMRSFIRQDNSIDFEPLTFTNITHQNPSGDPEGLWKLYDFDANTLYCVTFGGDGMPKVNACESEVHYSWTSAIDSDYFPTQAAPATTAAPAGNVPDVVVNALAVFRVDNSNMQLSVTLVWDKPCDLEIYAWQPDGAKLYYDNMGVLPSTGRLDANNGGSLNSDGIAVENVAWETAPAGTYRIGVEAWQGCSSDIDYKLYVQIDGVTTSYDRTVAEGETSLNREVLSFSL